MRVSEENRKRLVEELRYITDRINKETDLRKKLYFFANVAATIRSVLDFEYDPQLIFAEFVFEVSSNVIGATLEDNLSGKDTSISLIPQLFDQLSLSIEELVVDFEEGQDTYKALQRVVELAHTTTARGYYLYTKGHNQ